MSEALIAFEEVYLEVIHPKSIHLTPPPAHTFQGQKIKKTDLENPTLIAIVNTKKHKAMSFEEMEPRFQFEFRTNFAICKSDSEGIWVESSEISRVEHELKERTSGIFKIYSL